MSLHCSLLGYFFALACLKEIMTIHAGFLWAGTSSYLYDDRSRAVETSKNAAGGNIILVLNSHLSAKISASPKPEFYKSFINARSLINFWHLWIIYVHWQYNHRSLSHIFHNKHAHRAYKRHDSIRLGCVWYNATKMKRKAWITDEDECTLCAAVSRYEWIADTGEITWGTLRKPQ